MAASLQIILENNLKPIIFIHGSSAISSTLCPAVLGLARRKMTHHKFTASRLSALSAGLFREKMDHRKSVVLLYSLFSVPVRGDFSVSLDALSYFPC